MRRTWGTRTKTRKTWNKRLSFAGFHLLGGYSRISLEQTDALTVYFKVMKRKLVAID